MNNIYMYMEFSSIKLLNALLIKHFRWLDLNGF